MTKNRYKFFVVLLIIIAFVSFPTCRSSDKIELREIEVEKVLDLSSLRPKIDEAVIAIKNSAAAIDLEGNLYFTDSQKHRLLKFSPAGEFVTQIGRIGMGKEGLYYPESIYFKDGRLYILDNSGKNVKIYNSAGEFISWLKLENAFRTHCASAANGDLFLNVIYNDQENYNNQELISRFSRDGEKVAQFGRVIRSHKFIGHSEFNSCLLAAADNRLYGAFKNHPAFFCYHLNGEEIFYRYITGANLPEIQILNDDIDKTGADTPMNIKTPGWGIKVVNYFRGLSVDSRGRMYLALNYLTEVWHSVILCVDPGGNPLVKYRLRSAEGDVERICQLLVRGESDFYALGYTAGQKSLCLFRFKKGGK